MTGRRKPKCLQQFYSAWISGTCNYYMILPFAGPPLEIHARDHAAGTNQGRPCFAVDTKTAQCDVLRSWFRVLLTGRKQKVFVQTPLPSGARETQSTASHICLNRESLDSRRHE